jgi:hypothetical protein
MAYLDFSGAMPPGADPAATWSATTERVSREMEEAVSMVVTDRKRYAGGCGSTSAGRLIAR